MILSLPRQPHGVGRPGLKKPFDDIVSGDKQLSDPPVRTPLHTTHLHPPRSPAVCSNHSTESLNDTLESYRRSMGCVLVQACLRDYTCGRGWLTVLREPSIVNGHF